MRGKRNFFFFLALRKLSYSFCFRISYFYSWRSYCYWQVGSKTTSAFKKALCAQGKLMGTRVNVVMIFICSWHIKDKCQLIYLLMDLLKAVFILSVCFFFFFPQALTHRWIVQTNSSLIAGLRAKWTLLSPESCQLTQFNCFLDPPPLFKQFFLGFLYKTRGMLSNLIWLKDSIRPILLRKIQSVLSKWHSTMEHKEQHKQQIQKLN